MNRDAKDSMNILVKQMVNESPFERTERLLGIEGMKRLHDAKVAVFGVGGVGGYAIEAFARSGVGTLDLIDRDVVSISNLNRQIIALRSTVGIPKVNVMAERIHLIDPDIVVNTHECFYLPETHDRFHFEQYDYVVDAVDTITAKIDIIMECKKAGTPVISSMGAGNKLDPTRFRVADIYETSVCPLAKVMRKELKARGVENCKVVYSSEPPVQNTVDASFDENRKKAIGSVAYVPSVVGMILASEVIKDLLGC